MEVTVYHQKVNELTGCIVVENDCPMFDVVAKVTVDTSEIIGNPVNAALEFAWRWTNNLGGSWSRSRELNNNDSYEMDINMDFNEAVEVLLPNDVHNGQEYGRRSSMVGDVFAIGSTSYKVAMCGFEKV